MQAALAQAVAEGGEVLYGGAPRPDIGPQFVEPAIVRMPAQTAVVQQETFAPILYILEYDHFDEALALHNDVPQGLSSAIFTESMREAEEFLSRARIGLRHRQRQHRHVGRRDRRRIRRREGNRRRPRVGLRRLEGLHAPADQHRELVHRPAAGAGNHVRGVKTRELTWVSPQASPSGWGAAPLPVRPSAPGNRTRRAPWAGKTGLRPSPSARRGPTPSASR